MEQLTLNFETPKRKAPRKLSLSFKLSVLDTIADLPQGKATSFIRELGIAWVQISAWRRQREQGELGTKVCGTPPGKKRGPYKKSKAT